MTGLESSLTVSGISFPSVNAQLVFGIGGPSRFFIESQLQGTPPPRLSTITLTQGSVKLKWKDCALVDPSLQIPATSAAKVTLCYMDRRWRWVTGGNTVSGKFNVRDSRGKLDPKYEKAPIDILKEVFGKLGESNVDMGGVDNTLRPEIEWDAERGYSALTQILGMLGCRDALTYKDKIRVVRLGMGKNLPRSTDEMSGGDSVSDGVAPNDVEIVCAPTSIECDLKLEPVGVEIGDEDTLRKYRWKHANELSYAPRDPLVGPVPKGTKTKATFWKNPNRPSTNIPEEFTKPTNFVGPVADDYKPQCLALADQYIFKAYRVVGFGDGSLRVPGEKKPRKIDVEQIHILGQLNDRDPNDPNQFAEAFVHGEHFIPDIGGLVYPLNRRVDAGFSIDAENRLVIFSTPVYMLAEGGASADSLNVEYPNIYLRTCINILNSNHMPERYAYKKPTGAKNRSGSLAVRHDEIVRRITIIAKPSGKKINRNSEDDLTLDDNAAPVGSKWETARVLDNKEEVDKQADFYLKRELKRLLPDDASQRSYNCLKNIEPDGRIQQVSFNMSGGVLTTEASLNNEFVPTNPRYEDRVAKQTGKK